MDRTLHKISICYAVDLTDDEVESLLLRDRTRKLCRLKTLGTLLYETYTVGDIEVRDNSIFFSMYQHGEDEEELELILNDIEMYIEGIENEWTGVDSQNANI